jgi:hypothetical protein
MARLTLGMVLEKDKGIQDNLTALFQLVKSAIPEQGAQISITITTLPKPNQRLTLHDIFPHIFKPRKVEASNG